MANIFVKSGGDFSALTFQKVVAGQTAIKGSGKSGGYNLYDAITTARYQAFTPSEAGDCEGIMVCLRLYGKSASKSVTVTLQQNTGSWVDVASKNLTEQAIAGTHYDNVTNSAMVFPYFEFASPVAITTASNTWRIKVEGDQVNTAFRQDDAGGYCYAVVLTATTTYSSGDNLYTNQDTTITIDQSVTLGTLTTGVNSIIAWENPASASYTLTITTWYICKDAGLNYGTEADPILATNRGTIDITNWNTIHNYEGPGCQEFKIYGERPTSVLTHVAADSTAGTAILETEDDMSAIWTAGDVCHVYGGNASYLLEVKTIDSISGTTVTFTTNLSSVHYAGWGVVNTTRAKNLAGVVFEKDINPSAVYGNSFTFILIGAWLKGGLTVVFGEYAVVDVVRFEPVRIEDVFFADEKLFNLSFYKMLQNQYNNGISIKNLYLNYPSFSAGILTVYGKATITDVYIKAYYSAFTLTAFSATITRFMIGASYNSAGYCSLNATLDSCTVENMKIMAGGRGLLFTGNNNTFTNCEIDNCADVAIELFGLSILNKFINCTFGGNIASTATFRVGIFYLTWVFISCSFDDTALFSGDLTTTADGSSIAFQEYDKTANEHRVSMKYGKTNSTGTGLVDTTAHTAGGFALQLESQSSLFPVEWAQTIPTGNIQNKTMMVGVWCKIANAAYYGGTHQKPRLTINYDNGTTAYAEALGHTDWQLLSVAFAPTTTYGQIMATISAMTDQTGSNACAYFDDYIVLYPAGVQLNLGSMDLWVDALPVVPTIATNLSAQDVWTALDAIDYGVGTMGELVKKTEKKVDDATVMGV